jgi:predicted ATPase
MIKTFRATNYRCLRDATARLTPLHAFIGPNDSGKSTLLEGLRTIAQFAGGSFVQLQDGRWLPFDPDLPDRYVAVTGRPGLLGCEVEGGTYEIEMVDSAPLKERVRLEGGESEEADRRWNVPAFQFSRNRSQFDAVLRQFGVARLVRFDPDALRAPSGLIPDFMAASFLDDRGHGLPGVFFALRNSSDEAFAAVVEGVRKHFPTIKTLRVKPVTTSSLVIEAELLNGVRVDARRMSEGVLYYLAFAALRHLEPSSLLLVEEPENGLHPARIADVVRMLRAIVDEAGTQVILATHSPLVINELQPEEVTVVTRPSLEEGTRLTPITETHNFQRRSSVYALGELWLSFADGVDEGPLLRGRGA